MRDEANPDIAFQYFFSADVHIICTPNSPDADPFAFAESCELIAKNAMVCILIPGRRFDALGTRKGRGHGWYDRFLSRVPAGWLRIGIARARDVSRDPLPKQPWDECVDVLMSCFEDGHAEILETNARTKDRWADTYHLLLASKDARVNRDERNQPEHSEK